MLRSGLPWLIEGPRGGGKTALAEALAIACNLPVFYLQGMEGPTLADVLYDWDREGQTQGVRQAVAAGSSFLEARAGQWTREFLKLGEALAAYEWAANNEVVPILICDEFDKSAKNWKTCYCNYSRAALRIFRVSGKSECASNNAGRLWFCPRTINATICLRPCIRVACIVDTADPTRRSRQFASSLPTGRTAPRLEVKLREPGAKGFAVLAHRWVVERTNAWVWRARRNSKDYERLPASSEAMVKITKIHLLLRRLRPVERPAFNYACRAEIIGDGCVIQL